ncbi:hypothetical protein QUF50_04160 [Thiotrichales bacterium HSG1]|nr:hypothetical protein [Thiotrichales bacterium HSG1]
MKIYSLLIIALVFSVSNTVNAKELDTEGFTKTIYPIVIPEGYVVSLYETPAKQGEMPDSKLEVSLKKGDKVQANIVTKLSNIADNCKNDKKAYKWIYTKDWFCVKVTSSSTSIGKIGWLNKMFVNLK